MNGSREIENVFVTKQGEGNSVKVSDRNVNIRPVLVAGCSSLNELTRPIYSDHTSQVTGNFLNDLHLYFDLKCVSEFLKLP